MYVRVVVAQLMMHAVTSLVQRCNSMAATTRRVQYLDSQDHITGVANILHSIVSIVQSIDSERLLAISCLEVFLN